MAPEFWSCPQFAFPGATIKSRAREEAEKYTRTGFLPGTEHFVGAVQNSEGRRTCTRCGDAAEWQHASKGDTIHTAPAIVTIATCNLPNAVSQFRFESRAREEAEKYTRTGFLPGTQHLVGAGQNSEGRRTCTRCGDAA